MVRLLQVYEDKIVPFLVEEFSYNNKMQVPKLSKIVVNIGVGSATIDKKRIDKPFEELALITGQKPVLCYAKKSIASFKLREGTPIGCKVTLRNVRMYEFLDRLINVALPRVKDFKGFSGKGFDGRGNYNMGLKEQLIFPEIDYNSVDEIRGMNLTFVTTANTDQEAKVLLKQFNMPFMDK